MRVERGGFYEDEISTHELIARLNRALGALVIRDRYLLERDVSERAITHKLAEYLQDEFPNWNVDCEYNRDGHEPKRLGFDDKVLPDIIVHRRGEEGPNLMVIEVKKSNNAQRGGEQRDLQKLQAYLRKLSYKAAVFIEFDVGRLRVLPYRMKVLQGDELSGSEG